jgi:hypothetical protein
MSKAYAFIAAIILPVALVAYVVGGGGRAGEFGLLLAALALPVIIWGLGSLQGSLDRIEKKLGIAPKEEDPDADLKDGET